MTSFDAPLSSFKLPETPPDGLAVYVHWPWCVKKCPYCDFNAHVNLSRDEPAYFSCILNELNHVAEKVGKRSLTSLFFGGGTPSLASAGDVGGVIAATKALFSESASIGHELVGQGAAEVTLEVNPATYRPEMFHKFVRAGVTRFSIGVQSLNAAELSFLGRAHNVDEALKTIEMALESGAEVSVDFIYGLPEQDLGAWEKQLTQITAMGTHHLSAYQLTIEPHTKFFAEVHKNKWQPLDADRQADFYLATKETLLAAGLHQYEISNFARMQAQSMGEENSAESLLTNASGAFLGQEGGAEAAIIRGQRPEWTPKAGMTQGQGQSQEAGMTLMPGGIHESQGSRRPQSHQTNISERLLACRHNLHVWRYGDYLGVGAGAHGRITPAAQHRTNAEEISLITAKMKNSDDLALSSPIPLLGKIATRNFKMPETYIKEVQDKNHALYEEIPLTSAMAAQEAILNGLRLIEGVHIEKESKIPSNVLSKEAFYWPNVLLLEKEGFLILAEHENGYQLSTTPKGQLLLDSVLEKIQPL